MDKRFILQALNEAELSKIRRGDRLNRAIPKTGAFFEERQNTQAPAADLYRAGQVISCSFVLRTSAYSDI
jgi:hypothetical protein